MKVTIADAETMSTFQKVKKTKMFKRETSKKIKKNYKIERNFKGGIY